MRICLRLKPAISDNLTQARPARNEFPLPGGLANDKEIEPRLRGKL
jgi:hypothetical protein